MSLLHHQMSLQVSYVEEKKLYNNLETLQKRMIFKLLYCVCYVVMATELSYAGRVTYNVNPLIV